MLDPGTPTRAPDEPLRAVRTRFPDDEARTRSEARRVMRRALVSYVAASVGVLAVVGIGASTVTNQVATSAAVRDAGYYTQQFARLAVAQRVSQALVDGDPAAVAALDRVVRTQMSEHEVLRVKVWSATGRILYSDEPRLIGRTYAIEPEERGLLETLGVDAHVSPSVRPENEFESGFGRTLEVYAGVVAANGDPVLVEAYLPIDRLSALRNTLERQITPLVVLSLLILELLLLPLAIALARRIARGHHERATLSLLAAHAAEAERRSIAAELHDGVIQDLVAVGFGLGTVQAVAQRDGRKDVSAAAQQLNDIVRDDVRVLRGMIASLGARDFSSTPVSQVLLDATAEAERAGYAVAREVESVEPARDVHTALCLVAREAIRNAVRHAGGQTLTVRLVAEGGEVVLEIADDGCGFDPARAATTEQGHLGLTLYAQAARAAGGRYTLRTAPGEGTRLTFRVPLRGVERPSWWRALPWRGDA
jgi:signal transduction histidine kinase